MSLRIIAALVVETVLLVAAYATVSGGGETKVEAVATGAVLMAVVAVPSLVALVWGRSRSHAAFMNVVGAVFLGKMLYVGVVLVFVNSRTGLPRREFVFGLLAGWLVGFLAQAIALRVTTPAPDSTELGRGQALEE